MQYEAKNDGTGKPVSQANNLLLELISPRLMLKLNVNLLGLTL